MIVFIQCIFPVVFVLGILVEGFWKIAFLLRFWKIRKRILSVGGLSYLIGIFSIRIGIQIQRRYRLLNLWNQNQGEPFWQYLINENIYIIILYSKGEIFIQLLFYYYLWTIYLTSFAETSSSSSSEISS